MIDAATASAPDPDANTPLVEACGVCNSDSAFVNAAFPDVKFPLVTGHEIAGRVDALGDGVEGWIPGDRVAIGWFGGNCGFCLACREGDFIHCERLQVPGYSYPGGYSEAVIVPATALARIPDAVSAVEAAPMGCAGVTTFNALRRSAARPGDLAALTGVRPMTETRPLEDTQAAYDRMLSGDARFRMVLTTGK